MQGRVCPAAALQRPKILGIKFETLMPSLLGLFILQDFFGTLIALGIMVPLAAFNEYRIKDKPEGYSIHSIAASTSKPFVQRYLGGYAQSVARMWTESGLLPPAGVQKRFEP